MIPQKINYVESNDGGLKDDVLLVGGFNPSEKILVKIGIFPK